MASIEEQLTVLVRQQLLTATATISDYRVEELTGGFSGAIVHRFYGKAVTMEGVRPWSFIRKRCHPESGSAEPSAHNYWRREVAYYESDLATTLPPNLKAPRCFAIEATTDGGYWLWLEDMGTQELTTQWPLADYGVAARHLGHFNGIYLTEQPLPHYPWLRRPDVHERLQLAEPGIAELPALQRDPHFAALLPGDHVERMQRLWARREPLLTALAQLPQTFCHRDAFHRNLLIRHEPNGTARTAALDWGLCGLGILGEELVPLFAVTLKFVFADATELAALEQTIFAGYLAGLRDAGWGGDERLVRFGFTALTALKDAVAEPAIKLPNVARRIAALPPGVEPPRLLNPGGPELLVAVQEYTLGMGEEACDLLCEIDI